MAYQVPNFSDLYGPYNRQNALYNPVAAAPAPNPLPPPPPSPTPNPTPAAPGSGGDPLHALILSLLGGSQQATAPAFDFASLLKELRGDTQGDFAAETSLPSYAGNVANPFNSGFFKSAAQRAQIERDRLGVPGFVGRRLAAGLPAY